MKNKNTKSFSELKLLFVRILVWCIIFYERIWPRLLPFFLTLSLLCSLSWFGIFNALNYWAHLFLLWLVLFIAVGSLFLLFGFRFPTIKDINDYIERTNDLKHQPLNVQADRLYSDDEGDITASIWREHQRRMAEQLHHLQIRLVYLKSASYDPMALRSVFVLLCVCAFSFSFGSSGGRLTDAFDFRPTVDETLMRIDAWVIPPAYTGIAPIYLTRSETTQFTIPEGSQIVVRVANGAGVTVTAISEEDGQKISLTKKNEQSTLNDSIVLFETHLERSIYLSLSSRHKEKKWHLQMIKDQLPTIRWSEKPGRILSGSLELQYEMSDDYGVTNAFAEIEPFFDQKKNSSLIYKAPEIKLLLARGGKGKMRMVQDLSSHPWAGSEVKITLVAKDDAGQQGRSKTFIMTLPQRIFANPVARAVSEQCRLLALNASAREHVLDMLFALLLHPENGLQDTTHFLLLQSAWTRLSMAQTEDQLRDIVDYLWNIALGIEDDQFESAQQRLKQAQAALRDALRHGASATEIERLMADLRQAVNDYINALAEKAPEDKDSIESNLSTDKLQKKLNSIEEMAKMGSSSAAEQLLAEIEQTLDHLQVRKSHQTNEQNNNQTIQMKKKMDQLGDLMRRQQEILNDTHNLETEQQHGNTVPKVQSESLKKRQNELQSELSILKKELTVQGFGQSDALAEAEEKMNSAGDAFDKQDYEFSIQNQSDALEALRQGAQNVLKKMREMLNKAEDNQNSIYNPKDPLGRPLSPEIGQKQEDVIEPKENDRMRARQILDEIRKRLNNEHISEEEKNYLERLLHFN
ncbi:MAG: Methyl-accepting chemotaxis protein [Bartonella clarridgeiae]|uniref:TIGR02302 family protein n=1 Tax=Bartonella clarridgeiae TaxID=56426 RepID=UPI0023F21066|nr:TIGR02302 family protein [Bartonella clarridgeiae]WCR55761.1 MAG: Methyl-accepting chemotaxis protein [Bartonella clarridgeiae]